MISEHANTFFCPNGCNAFTTADPAPDCAACDSPMTTDPADFDDVHEAIEIAGITEVTRQFPSP